MAFSKFKSKIHPQLFEEIKQFSPRPCQKKALNQGLLNQQNILVCSPTASGKTLVAEIAAINEILKTGKKAVYIVPLKSLASEKYDEFQQKYEKLGVKIGLSIGDLDSKDSWLKSKDLIIVTSEKMDSLIRHNAPWIPDIRIVIADEIHLLNDDSRGPTLEVLLTILKTKIKKIQLIALSATIGNPRELADWLDAELVYDEWRPVKLNQGFLFESKITLKKNQELLPYEKEELLSLIKHFKKKDSQMLIFCPTKATAEASAEKMKNLFSKNLISEKEKILSALSRPTRQCKRLAECIEKGVAFHHAGLVHSQKKLIENSFRESKIKAIFCTPTLAMGLNLPADVVIMKSLKRFSKQRGIAWIPVLEYHQMCLPYTEKLILKSGKEIEIGDIVENKLKDKILSFNSENNSIQFKEPNKFYKSKASKIITLKTTLGTEIKLTDNHPILIQREGKLSWVNAKQINTNDKIIYQAFNKFQHNKLPFFYELLPKEKVFVKNVGFLIQYAKEKLNITEKELAKKLDVYYKLIYHYKNNIKAIPLITVLKLCNILEYDNNKTAKIIQKIKSSYGSIIHLPKKINDDFLWLVGLIATDGNLNKQIDKRTKSEYTNIRISNTNKNIINKAIDVLKKFGFSPYISKKDNLITIEVGSTLLAKVIKTHFKIPYNNKTCSVKIPEVLLSSNPKKIGAYLAGVFDGDGTYTNISNKKFPKTKNRRILFATSSKEFSEGIHKLLLRLGIISKISEDRKITSTKLKGKKVTFAKPKYYVYFYKIKYIAKFQKNVKPVKAKINVKYSNYHNKNKYLNLKEDYEFIGILSKKTEKGSFPVYNLQIKDNENYFASNILVHNCGRAGRPQSKSKEGIAISIAKTLAEKEIIEKKYINGKSEPILSKLAVEPILRQVVLALVASKLVLNKEDLLDFFKKTFYGLQYGDDWTFEGKILSVLKTLQKYIYM